MAKAFTLIEMLATTAIIGTLIGITLPGLSKMREKARMVKCHSNLHQYGIGLANYYGDYKAYAPFNNQEDFIEQLQPYVGDRPRELEPQNFEGKAPYWCADDLTGCKFNQGFSYYYLRFGVADSQFIWNNFDNAQGIVMMDGWPRHYKNQANYLFGGGNVKLVTPGFPYAP